MSQRDSETLIKIYRKRTPRSQRAFEEAKWILPGGSTREVIFYPPYPVYVTKGRGCHVWDLDGHEIIDFVNNFLALILGHAYPKIVAEIQSQAADGTAFSSPTEDEAKLGEAIQQRMPSVRRMRFTNSGSEATTLALLAARGFTGRQKIAKFEGAHHGTNEATMVSTTPPIQEAGDPAAPTPVPDGPHIPDSVLRNTVVLPFNNTEATERVVKRHRKDLAAVIVEPILGAAGIIPAGREFMSSLREVTEKNDIPLIFDEVVTGFRVARGGAQENYRVTPDLTAMGKNLGGGLPLGAFGGREDIMAQFEPTRSPRISHSGSLNANPLSARAALVLLDNLTPSLYERLNEFGGEVARGLRMIFGSSNLDAQVTQVASLFGVHFTEANVVDYRSATSEDAAHKYAFFLGILIKDVMISPRGIGCISAPMGRREVGALLEATVDSVDRLKER
jgi:glutamate-1-semialdehyde 2,1-aminomutase